MKHSLKKQVFYRITAALIASGLVVILAAVWFQSRVFEKSVLNKQQETAEHFRNRIADIHLEWETEAIQMKYSLEFTRALEMPGRRSERLSSFFLTQDTTSNFTHAIIGDAAGNELFRYGDDVEALPAFKTLARQELWFYHPARKTVYHVFNLPVWLGKAGMGTMLLLKPLDNALLGRIAYLHTDLYILSDGQPVASSLGQKGIDQFALVNGRTSINGTRYTQITIPWKDPDGSTKTSPVLVVRAKLDESLSKAEITLIVLVALAVLVIVISLLLGVWINRIISNIVDLKNVAVSFARERTVPAVTDLPVAGKAGEGSDELAELGFELIDMMQTVAGSEQRFKDVVAAAGEYVWEIDAEGRLTYVSERVVDIIGYSEQEVLGKTPFDFSVTEEAARLRQIVADAVRNKRDFRDLEQQYIHKSGDLKWLRVTGVPIFAGGQLAGYRGTALDITERKLVEDKLHEQDRRQKAILNNIPDMAWLKDRESRFIAVNEPFGNACGHAPEALVGKTDFDIWPAELAKRYQADDKIVIETGVRKHVEEPLIDRNDQKRWIETIKTPIYNDRGEIIGTTGIARDVTERKMAEEKVIEALREKEMLLQEVHHRVKNNLQIVSSLLYLQSENIKDQQTFDLFRESRDRIKSMAIVHEKLYRSKDLSMIEFDSYIESLVSYLSHSYGAGAKGIMMDLHIERFFLNVDVAVPCGLIITELISNAIKYAFPNTGKGIIRIAASVNRDNNVDLSISDNGAGLPPGFAVGDANTLGLRLVNNLTGQLHGKIEARSDGGTVFNIIFPLKG